MPMLKHTPTGDLYIYTAQLAKRSDMELVEESPIPEDLRPKAKRKAKPEPVVTPVVEPESEFGDPLDDVDLD